MTKKITNLSGVNAGIKVQAAHNVLTELIRWLEQTKAANEAAFVRDAVELRRPPSGYVLKDTEQRTLTRYSCLWDLDFLALRWCHDISSSLISRFSRNGLVGASSSLVSTVTGSSSGREIMGIGNTRMGTASVCTLDLTRCVAMVIL